MQYGFAWALCAALTLVSPALADTGTEPRFQRIGDHADAPDGRQSLGRGRLATNDAFGDNKDRWRTGSFTSSHVWGHHWDGDAPYRIGDLLELRLQGQIIAPARLDVPAAGDRPWAGAISAGLHTHFTAGQTELSFGGDLVFVGPQTGLDRFQNDLHDLLSIGGPSAAVLGGQIGDTIRPTLVMEAGRTFQFGEQFRMRPFAEGRAGDETLIRVGADLTIGIAGLGELLMRENVSGHRYRTIKSDRVGFSFVLGADLAHVFDSIYLPEARGYQLVENRERARMGVQWQNAGTGLFYGVTWLGREFAAQPEGQVIGSLKLDIQF